MHGGLVILKLSPKDFWAATPRELMAALGDEPQPSMTRGEFAQLTERFPDNP